MSEQQESQPFGRNTCHICGGTYFTWGKLTDWRGTYFVSDEEPRKFLGGFNREEVRARKCNTCKNIQIFGADEK